MPEKGAEIIRFGAAGGLLGRVDMRCFRRSATRTCNGSGEPCVTPIQSIMHKSRVVLVPVLVRVLHKSLTIINSPFFKTDLLVIRAFNLCVRSPAAAPTAASDERAPRQAGEWPEPELARS